MSEPSGDAEARLSQAMRMALSLSLSAAMQVQQRRTQQARQARQQSEQAQREYAEQAAAERETAAVLWRRVGDRDWIRDHPDQVAQAWASARAWEPLDERAAEAREKFDVLLRRMYGVEHPEAIGARDSEDYSALAQLLAREVEVTPVGAEARYWEQVPEGERAAWLERQVWGPEVDENTRIARSEQLADLHRGVPVSVLRQMPEETRQAWIAFDRTPEAERRAWVQQWAHRELWGRQDLSDEQRAARMGELAQLGQLGDDDAAGMSTEAWHAWVEQVRESGTSSRASAEPGQRQDVERSTAVQQAGPGENEERLAAGETDIGEQHSTATGESAEQLQQRAAATVWQEWPEHVAGEVTESRAFGAMAHRMGQLEQRGWSMPEVLGMLGQERLIGTDAYGREIRNSAAFGEYLLKELETSLPERGAATDGISQLERYVAANAEGAVAEQHRGQARDERGGQQRAEQASDSPALSDASQDEAHQEAGAHQQAAVEHEAAAGEAQQLAQREAYPEGAEPPRLAGQGYPQTAQDALKAQQRSAAMQDAKTTRAVERGAPAPQRERGGR